jgi:phenylacetate-CoA ligase
VSGGLAVALRELRYVPEVWRAPHRTREDLDRRALRGVNDLLAYCRARVPHYRGAAYPDAPLTSLADLAGMPLLAKRDVLTAGVAEFRAPGLSPRGYRVDVTSGTTGTRLEIWHDVNAYGYHGATVLRRFLGSGFRPWWRVAHIKPFPRPVRWFQRLGLFPRVVVPAGQSDEDIARQVLATRPHLIMGYPLVLRGLLRTLTSEDRRALARTLRLVMTDSELLTDDAAALLAQGFGVPVFDEYSAYEVLTVSSQCRAGSMHVDEDRVVLEIVDPQGRPVPDGVEGSVVVTHYRERAMPLLRYQLGDRAARVPGDCSCGSSFQRMKLVSGRINDCVVLPDGRRVYSGVFLSLAMFTPGVAECMVRQDAQGRITIHLVPEGTDDADDDAYGRAVTAFRQRFAALVDAPVDLSFRRSARVELTPGGKGKFVESAYRPDGG